MRSDAFVPLETQPEEDAPSGALAQIPVESDAEERAREARQRLERQRTRRRAVLWVLAAAFVVATGFGAREAVRRMEALDLFRISTLELAGDAQKVPLSRMREAVEGTLAGTYFSLDLDAVRRAAETVPWVRSAVVRRVWPSGVRIDVDVYEAMAVYEDGRLVSTEGVLFAANPDEQAGGAALPAFYGAAAQIEDIARHYRLFRDETAKIPAVVTDIYYSDRGSWSFVMENAWMPPTKVELGRESEEDPVKGRLERLVAAYPEVVRLMKGPPSTIDARYAKAFAAGAPDRASVRRHFETQIRRRDEARAAPVEASEEVLEGDEAG